jgi:CRP/FNR family cyclic AMP-dependent transcriptional regulator
MVRIGVGHPVEKRTSPDSESDPATPRAFFSSFFKEHETDLVGCGPVEPHPAATEIFHEDARADIVYLIERGLVKLSRTSPEGDETVIGLRGRYWFLGTPAVLLGIPYSITALTLTPSLLRAISAECLLRLLKTDGAFSWEMHRHLSQLLLLDSRKVVESRLSAEERLGKLLSLMVAELAYDKIRAQGPFQVPLTHHELAAIIGLSSEYLCRLVNKIEKRGFLIVTDGMLTIKDVSKLSRLI